MSSAGWVALTTAFFMVTVSALMMSGRLREGMALVLMLLYGTAVSIWFVRSGALERFAAFLERRL